MHTADHPRSRGVYRRRRRECAHGRGSSPLARGLRLKTSPPICPDGIIPARAGFTHSEISHYSHLQDHPRSRGVYGSSRTVPSP